MPAAVTLKSRQRRMLDFYNLANSKYVLIGRSSAWTNELIPPTPSGNETTLDELIGCKIVKYQWFVKMLIDPTEEEKNAGVYYKGHYYYKTTSSVDAVSNGCTAVLVYSELDRDELPLTTFRQVGLQVQVANSSEVMSVAMFNNLSDKGSLEVIENRKPQVRAEDQMESIYMLIAF